MGGKQEFKQVQSPASLVEICDRDGETEVTDRDLHRNFRYAT
jgi:hypothetical protein